MKKLLSSAALAGLLAVAAAPAMAQGDQSALKLDLGGYFRGYMAYTSQDTRANAPAALATNADERNIDILRDTEVHFTGETTLDNGLTVGVHVESTTDMGDGFAVDESYMYTSGSWGRVNFGGEDGAAYLLQVAAPSADSNIDGIRQYVNGFNYAIAPATAHTPTAGVTDTPFNFSNISPASVVQTAPATLVGGIYVAPVANSAFNAQAPAADADGANTWGRWNGAFLQDDYAQDATRFADKLSYLSPVFNGFQAGVSYTPDVTSGVASRGLNGVGTDDAINSFGDAWDLAARYEGQFDQFGLTLGAGYTHIDLEETRPAQTAAGVFQGLARNAFTDDRDIWNVGGTVTVGGFGFGALYTEDDRGSIAQDDGATRASYTADSDSETWVLGADYTTGPWKVGASYLSREVENMAQTVTGVAGTFVGYQDLETDRYSGGLTYTYGPGMTFRGSVHYIDHEVGSSDAEATTFVLGTQVNF